MYTTPLEAGHDNTTDVAVEVAEDPVDVPVAVPVDVDDVEELEVVEADVAFVTNLPPMTLEFGFGYPIEDLR